MEIIKFALVLFAIYAITCVIWRWASDRYSLPCPSTLAWLLDNPILQQINGTKTTLERLRLKPGEKILEVGPGPGRLLIPAAQRILPGGQAYGIELQPGMVERLTARAKKANVSNLTVILGDATEPHVPDATFDLVFLCTALGEIPDRSTAIKRCFDAVRPGGRLSITEMLGDPHYQSLSKVRSLAESTGLTFTVSEGSWWFYTATFTKSKTDSPKTTVLRNVAWCFSGERFTHRANFDSAVHQYQLDIQKEGQWNPDLVVIPYPTIRVMYLCWDNDEQIEPVIELTASNGESFTAGDLLFQIHNAVVEQLRELDHKFFEGLELREAGDFYDAVDFNEVAGGYPFYSLRVGS